MPKVLTTAYCFMDFLWLADDRAIFGDALGERFWHLPDHTWRAMGEPKAIQIMIEADERR